MTESSLSSKLDHYVELVATLPLAEPRWAPDPTKDYYEAAWYKRYVEVRHQILDSGVRVTDRLLQGATSAEPDQVEAPLGWQLPPDVREWFSWRNGHKGGLVDEVAFLTAYTPDRKQRRTGSSSSRRRP